MCVALSRKEISTVQPSYIYFQQIMLVSTNNVIWFCCNNLKVMFTIPTNFIVNKLANIYMYVSGTLMS